MQVSASTGHRGFSLISNMCNKSANPLKSPCSALALQQSLGVNFPACVSAGTAGHRGLKAETCLGKQHEPLADSPGGHLSL